MNINKGLGYLSIAAITIAALFFIGNDLIALAVAGIGYVAIIKFKD